MNTTLFSFFSSPMLDLFPLEIIHVVENIYIQQEQMMSLCRDGLEQLLLRIGSNSSWRYRRCVQTMRCMQCTLMYLLTITFSWALSALTSRCFIHAYNIHAKFGRMFGTCLVSLPKLFPSAECPNLTFGISLESACRIITTTRIH